MKKYFLPIVVCLLFVLSLNAKALVINGCVIEAYAQCAGANLNGASLSNADFYGSNLSNATLVGADLFDANLQSADLRYTGMMDADLTNAHFYLANLSWANLSNANLSGGYLVDANLTNAVIANANLTSANLQNANLANTRLTNANFSYANLKNANLSNTLEFHDAGWHSANFTGATYNQFTIFPTSDECWNCDFDPVAEGMIFVSEVPLPAGIYFFLSGLVGLGLIRGKN